jgi:hypothetical protein
VADDFFFAVVEDEEDEVDVSPSVELFFLAVAVVEALVVPDFFVVADAVVVDFLPVEAVVLAVAESFLCAQETKKTPATRSAVKEKTDCFIGLCKGSNSVQCRVKSQALSSGSIDFERSELGSQLPHFHKRPDVREQISGRMN